MRRAAISWVLALLCLVHAGPAAAQSETDGQVCTANVAVDLVPGDFDAELRDWPVASVALADADADCDDVEVVVWLLDAEGDPLALGTGSMLDGAADVPMTEGIAAVAQVAEVRVVLPVTDVLPTLQDLPPEEPLVLQEILDDGIIPRTGSDVLGLVVLAALAVMAGGWALRRGRGRSAALPES